MLNFCTKSSMDAELNFTLEVGNRVEVRRPRERGIGVVKSIDEAYHIWIVLEGVVEFDKVYGVGGDWYISEKL